MMNLAMKAGMNQMKDQAQNLIPNELKDKGEEKKDENIRNDPKEPNLEVKDKGKPNQPKKKKRVIIDKNLSVRMYSVLLFHTAIITILLFIVHLKYLRKFNENKDKIGTKYSWLIFAGCIILSILLSLLVSKVRCISTMYLNYIFYLILLALNAVAFVFGGIDSLFDYIISMLIMFDAGSITILFFSMLVKDAPSTFWLMCSCSAGHLIAMFILIKVFEDNKYIVLVFCGLAFAIYQTMNYNALDSYKASKNNTSIPSMMILPFELNLSFIKIIYYVLYGIFSCLVSCCCGTTKSKK
jgi:hypothetical protein